MFKLIFLTVCMNKYDILKLKQYFIFEKYNFKKEEENTQFNVQGLVLLSILVLFYLNKMDYVHLNNVKIFENNGNSKYIRITEKHLNESLT